MLTEKPPITGVCRYIMDHFKDKNFESQLIDSSIQGQLKTALDDLEIKEYISVLEIAPNRCAVVIKDSIGLRGFTLVFNEDKSRPFYYSLIDVIEEDVRPSKKIGVL